MRSKHLGKGLFQVLFFLWWWFAYSGWWYVVLIVPPSIILITLIIMPPLALILVLIIVAPILTLLLWLIKPRHILGMLYYLLSRLIFCTAVLFSTKSAKLSWAGLNSIYGTLLFSELCNMSDQIAKNLVICASHRIY